jgi:hypothetical protein
MEGSCGKGDAYRREVTGEKASASRHKKRGAIGEMAPPRKEMKQGRRQCRLGEDTNLLQAGGLARETSFEDLSNSPVPKSPLT